MISETCSFAQRSVFILNNINIISYRRFRKHIKTNLVLKDAMNRENLTAFMGIKSFVGVLLYFSVNPHNYFDVCHIR